MRTPLSRVIVYAEEVPNPEEVVAQRDLLRTKPATAVGRLVVMLNTSTVQAEVIRVYDELDSSPEINKCRRDVRSGLVVRPCTPYLLGWFPVGTITGCQHQHALRMKDAPCSP